MATATRRRAMGLPAVFLMAATAGVAQSFGRFAFGVVLPAVRSDLDLSNTIAGSLTTVNVGAYLLGTLAVASFASSYKLLAIMRTGFLFALTGLVTSRTGTRRVVCGHRYVLLRVWRRSYLDSRSLS